MKTAISIPDPIFEAAEGFAQRSGMSRSELYATAVAEYIAARKSENIIQKLNSVYTSEPSNVDTALNAMQLKTLPQEEW